MTAVTAQDPIVSRAAEMAMRGFPASAIYNELRPHITRAEVSVAVRTAAEALERIRRQSRAKAIEAAVEDRERQIAEAAAEADRIRRIFAPSPKSVAGLVARVSLESGIPKKDLLGRRRIREFVVSRHRLMYLCVMETSLSLPQIGRLLGGFDHTTILHGCRQHCRRSGDPLPRGMQMEGKRP